MPWLIALLLAGGVFYAVREAAAHAKNEPRLPTPLFRVGQGVLVSTPATQVTPAVMTPGSVAAIRFDGPPGTVTYDVDLMSGLSLPSVPESALSAAPKAS